MSATLNLYVECLSSSGTVGLNVGGSTGLTSVAGSQGNVSLYAHIRGCETGAWVNDDAFLRLDGPVFNTVTTAMRASRGGTLHLRVGTPSFTSVTNELQLDGENFTFSNLTSATPSVLSNSYGSTIIR
jgi:hypothetical protein